MPRSSFSLVAIGFAVLMGAPAFAKKEKAQPSDFAPALATIQPRPTTAGAIVSADGYAPLTSGLRARAVGDVLTIVLVERMNASKSNAATTNRGGTVGITPPTTGPLNLFNPSDVNMGGDQSFQGKGEASQSNFLTGDISVTIAAVYPNGTMLVRGEKQLTLNRGDERVQVSGLVRQADISADNRLLSSKVADARIRYVGKGEIARASRQGWLQRFFSAVSPF
jgi:flagellar L-ring protein FlgH